MTLGILEGFGYGHRLVDAILHSGEALIGDQKLDGQNDREEWFVPKGTGAPKYMQQRKACVCG